MTGLPCARSAAARCPYRIAALTGLHELFDRPQYRSPPFSRAALSVTASTLTTGWTPSKVAKICFVAGLTFWLGNAAVLGLGVTYHPQAAGPIDQLPDWLNRAVGIAILLVLISYVAWVWSAPREIGQGEWKVELPSGRSTLLQIGIGILDLGSCALAMYMLLPTHPDIGFVTMAVVFVSATLLGFRESCPGRAWRVRCRHAGGAVAIR
jgi:uncharacterized membrane protein YbhN (UPF0104 family)